MMAVPKQTHIFTSSQLNEFLTESRTCTDVLVSLITTERPRTEVTLSRPGLGPNYVTQMVAVLLKAAQSTDVAGVIELLSVLVGSHFFMNELVATSSSLASNNEEEEGLRLMTNLVEVLKQVSCRLPSSFANAFGLIIILQKRTEDMLLMAEGERRMYVANLSETLAEMRDNVMKKMVTHSNDNQRLPFEKQAPPDDFRNIPILPRVSDIFLGSRSAFLRKNKARGGYDNLQHYLDVQFRLYREDCISPLREGITQYVQEVSVGHSVRRLQDGRLYKNVSIQYVEHNVEGQMYKVKLDPEHAKRIKWKSSRRLLYGSLLCLSADSFHTMVFAVVAESEREDLMKDHTFKIVFPSEVGEVRLPRSATFTMVESTAYFEAYRHVLVGLQRLEDGELPFEKYIVRCMTDVESPLYLNSECTDYDLQPIVTEKDIFTRGVCRNQRLSIDVNDPISHWPSAEQLHLDQSQFEAFHAALTQEFVLIQGPPGTGKTHVGLQIAKVLLHNKDVWQGNRVRRHYGFRNMSLQTKERMLVVCYTNHALDQFMEGIVQFLDNRNKDMWRDEIVRVGGRSENEVMQKFSLKTRRHHHHCSRYEREEQNQKLDQLYKTITRLHQHISFIAYSLRHLQDTVLDVELLQPFMSPQHQKYFANAELPHEKLYRWLETDEKTWLRRSHNAYRKIHEIKNNPSANGEETMSPKASNEDNYEEDEAKKVEDDRRIEDDVLSVRFQEYIGLDVGKQIKDILLNLNSNQQVDKHFQSLLQREAQMTLAKLNANVKMEDEVAAKTINLKKLKQESRWQLYRYWVDLYKQHQTLQMAELEKEYYETIKSYEKEKKQVDAEILRASTVIGMTTTGAARYQDVLKEIGPRIVIVEEAAEVLEAHIVTALSPRCEHLILIGDHKQLEPKPSVMQLALKYNLSLSMFERMLNNGIKNHCLQRQHRMRPEISTLVRDIYNVLDDNENVFQYDHIMGVRKDVFFINHNQTEDYADDIRSYSNKHEARYVSNLCKYLLKQGYKGTQITVLAAYTGQMFCIRDCMPRQEFEGVRTVAIDNFQGEENDIILLSIVRSNNEGKIGFLSRENRICVALSRAKKGLYVIGNFDMFQAGNRRWADVVQKVKSAGQFGKSLPLYCQNHPHAAGVQAEDPSDFTKSPDGGCQLKCDFRLSCGHACRHYCHPIDREHNEYVCRRPCEKKCDNEHICKRKCHFDTECDCPIRMTKDLPCGHRAEMECCVSAQTFRCEVIVERKLRCGHLVNLRCHTDIEAYKCTIIVTRTLESCSHQADMQCCKNPEEYKCRTMVTRTLESCKHEAEVECSFRIQSYKCKITVNRILPRCGHEADMECYRNPADIMCDKTLTKTRENCGHNYDVRCSRFDAFYELQHRCKESVTKSWACSHTKVMKCHEATFAICQEKCLKSCDQNHICQKICHFPSNCKCGVEMKKIIPTCGHTQDIPCHEDPANVDCQTKIMKCLTKCKHEMMMECSADPSSYRFRLSCDVIVSKTVPNCHHTQTMKCSESPSLYRCKKIVGIPHPRCGHTVQRECSASPNSYTECDTIVSKQLPCGHNREMKCSEAKTFGLGLFRNKSRTDYQCNEDVGYMLKECGHIVTIPCHVKTYLDQPTDSVRLKAPTLPTCKTLVVKKFLCGHDVTVECSLSAQQTCSLNCSKKMACGHVCPRKCTQCLKLLTHGDCNETCGKRQICGHECTSTRCGLCTHCYKQCANFCPHNRCEHPCFRACTPCKEKCSLQCQHHSCSRLCHEECDRPPCNQPCLQLLKCKHPCMGYCGDPCPTLCLVCEPTKVEEFNDEWLSVGDIRIIRLEDCGHEHGVRYLDELFTKENTTLSLLCCPKCNKAIRWHPRYANRLKKQQRNVAAIKTILAIGSEDLRMERLFPTLCGGVEETRSYLQRFNTYLFLHNKLDHQDSLKSSYSWSMSTTGQLTKFLDNIKISAAISHQDASSINRALTKLSATWLLHIAGTHDTDLSSSDSETEGSLCENWSDNDDSNEYRRLRDVDEAELKSKGLERKKKKKLQAVTETNATLHGVEDLIKESEAFGQAELWKVQKTLGVLLSDQSEVKQIMKFPRLQTLGVHTDDWFTCYKGHIGSSACREENCIECVTGTPLASTYELFWGKWRANFEAAQNDGNSGRGSRRNRRGNKRGGDNIERGGRDHGLSGRGVESGERISGRGRTNDDEQVIPSGPVYMASPHQRKERRGQSDRGRGRGYFRGNGLGRGWWGGNDISSIRESGVVLDNSGSAGVGIRGGFGKERGGTGRKGVGVINRLGGFNEAETTAATVVNYIGVHNRGSRVGRGGEHSERGQGSPGRGRGESGRGRGDRGRGGRSRRKGRKH